jgi:hypothetical protein
MTIEEYRQGVSRRAGDSSARFRRREAALPDDNKRDGRQRDGKQPDGKPAVAVSKRRGYDGVPPRWARRRALLRRVQVVGGYLVVMGGLVLGGRRGWLPEEVFLALDFVLTVVVLYLPVYVLDTQYGRAGIADDRLTVFTVSGQRTLALDALKRVWLVRGMPSRNMYRRNPDLLFVTDGRRVRAALTSEAAVAAVARSVTAQTRVSRNARQKLTPEPVTFRRGAVMLAVGLASGGLFLALVVTLGMVAYALAYP